MGNTNRSSFANCVSLDEGDREVVIRILGSYCPAFEYSSSIEVDGAEKRGKGDEDEMNQISFQDEICSQREPPVPN